MSKQTNSKVNYKELKRSREAYNSLLLVMHKVNIEELRKVRIDKVTDFRNSLLTYEEILSEFEETYRLADEGKGLIAMAVLRNSFEELLFLIASAVDKDIKITMKTAPRDIRKIVENSIDLFSPIFQNGDIDKLYDHLSKNVHVSSIKESIKYLDSKKATQKKNK